MKKFKSATKNRGTTIILEDCQEAIEVTESMLNDEPLAAKLCSNYYKDFNYKETKSGWEICKQDIQKGNPQLKEMVENIVDDILGVVDDIQPIFSQSKQGYIRTDGETGTASNAELLMQGEELCAFKKKNSEEQPVKRGAGEGSYRILINTDVSWWGKPEWNCGLVGALIILLQRYAPVEVWIQQGWLGKYKEDGVTLFKLDFTAATDLTALSFWICHPYKDSVFSYLVNRALLRKDTATSCVAEIECDLMLRGDWFLTENISYNQIHNALHTDRIDMIARWIAKTGYKILYEDKPPEITDI